MLVTSSFESSEDNTLNAEYIKKRVTNAAEPFYFRSRGGAIDIFVQQKQEPPKEIDVSSVDAMCHEIVSGEKTSPAQPEEVMNLRFYRFPAAEVEKGIKLNEFSPTYEGWEAQLAFLSIRLEDKGEALQRQREYGASLLGQNQVLVEQVNYLAQQNQLLILLILRAQMRL